MAEPLKKEEQLELVDIKSNWEERIDSFDKLPINEKILQGIYGMGYQ